MRFDPLIKVACIALASTNSPAASQTSLQEQQLEVLPSESVPSEYGFRNGSFIAAPIPFSNPTIGTGLALGAAWLFSADPDSSSSSIGIGGFKTNNRSTAVGLSVDLYALSDKYHVSFLAGQADVTYAYTASPFNFDIDQSGSLYRLDLLYGFGDNFSAGIGLRQLTTKLTPMLSFDALPIEVREARNLEILKYGLLANWDWRDDNFFPTSGSELSVEAFHGNISDGVLDDYQKAVVSFRGFRRGLTDKDVIGFVATLCGASASAPFFDSCGVGLTDDFRGFSITEYIDETLLSLQAEYRGRFGLSRFGYAAFGGLASVGDDFGELFDTDLHSAAGIGGRLRLSNSFPVDFSVDLTFNDEGEENYYIYVGQAF